ncbi:hypothetical protein [Streptomyces sp. NPDC093707]|uniref:hypothetical protein n=1 Tax=Streptomyces sp. NPDC093707 TaxID=3154984 RepID=UPI00344E4C6E
MNVSEPNTTAVPLSRPAVEFPPVANGIDYLASVVAHLTRTEPPGARDLKYAILHLQAAVEVLLKARLQQEHWTLVFKDPGSATRDARWGGPSHQSFESCTTTAAVTRLRNIVGITISSKTEESLKVVAYWRNCLQHYGVKADAFAVDNRAAQVLDFLVAFVRSELLPALPEEEAAAAVEPLEEVIEALHRLELFTAARRKRLKRELADVADRTVKCWSCGELALVVGEAAPACRFCDLALGGPHEAAVEYLWNVLDVELEVPLECPACSSGALAPYAVYTLALPDRPQPLCFACGTAFRDIDLCDGCSAPYVPAAESDPGLCPGCLENRLARF